MKNVLFILLGLFCLPLLMGQTAEEEVMRLKQSQDLVLEQDAEEDGLAGENVETGLKPGQWNFSVGTSLSYMKGYGSGMMFYTAPSYTLSLNERWSFHGGLLASRYQGLNHTLEGEFYMPSAFNSLAVFAAASYRLNDKVVLHGTGIKQLMSAPVTPFTPYPLDDFSFGATYKIGENFSIGASVHMNNRNGYYRSPWNPGSFASPFYSPFPSPIGW